MNSHLIAVDLFSGCGGLTQGLKDSGYTVLGAVEVDSKARETYTLNHPDVPLIGADINELSGEDFLADLGLQPGQLDLLAGCPPCQGFSTLRSKNGRSAIHDVRNDLIDDFARLALAAMPKMIMMENVPALAKYEKFSSFVRALEFAGYSVKFKVLDVSAFGVAQRRKRLILSANRLGEAVMAIPGDRSISVRHAIQSLPKAGMSGDMLHDYPAPRRSERILKLIAAIPKNGGSRHSLPPEMRLKCHQNTTGFNDVYGRMHWDDVSPTITSGCTNPSKGRFLHPEENRAITLREAAMLQGFPPTYKFNVTHGKETIALMIGNALPPPFIAAHGKAMAKALRS